MNKSIGPVVVASILVISGCVNSTVVRNTENSECERRVHTDRERCLRNNKSSDEALSERNSSRQAAKDSWAAQTLERIKAEAGE